MIKNILVATDGSAASKVALSCGLWLAKNLGARLSGLHVLDVRALRGPFFRDVSGALGFVPFQNYEPAIEQILEERAKVILQGFVERAAKEGVEAKTASTVGIVPEIIVERGSKADLIVLGQVGEHAEWHRGMMGNTTESVVRQSSRPVLVVPDEFREIHRILVAYDGSTHSAGALHLGCELGAELHSPIRALIVTDDEVEAATLSAEASDYIDPFPVSSEIRLASGNPEEVILELADSCDADLIVMGAYGHGRIRQFILGSTTAYVIRKSRVPVLLAR